MSKRPKRWTPKGKGWRNVFDHGDSAMWLRLNKRNAYDGGNWLSCVVYLDWIDYKGNQNLHNGIWEIECKLKADILETLTNKVNRVYFVEGDPADALRDYGVLSYTRRPVPAGHCRRQPKTWGYRRWFRRANPVKRRRLPARPRLRVARRERPRYVEYGDRKRLPRKFR